MARIRDRWFNARRGPDGERVKSSLRGTGERWMVVYHDDTGKERSPTFVRKVDAERFMSTVEADKLRGTYVDPDKGKELFRVRAEAWRVDQVQHSPALRPPWSPT